MRCPPGPALSAGMATARTNANRPMAVKSIAGSVLAESPASSTYAANPAAWVQGVERVSAMTCPHPQRLVWGRSRPSDRLRRPGPGRRSGRAGDAGRCFGHPTVSDGYGVFAGAVRERGGRSLPRRSAATAVMASARALGRRMIQSYGRSSTPLRCGSGSPRLCLAYILREATGKRNTTRTRRRRWLGRRPGYPAGRRPPPGRVLARAKPPRPASVQAERTGRTLRPSGRTGPDRPPSPKQ